MMIVNDITIQMVLKMINVGRDFFILAQINKLDVSSVKKCIYHISIPNISPGTIIIALAIQALNSIML
jgi:hypothetical protein